ncbi:hypothetical protein Lsan_2456 [Legionella santicrucis]|uniref:Uncharacterized protein n=1 Tax=Legionella santicrucis TaxID=45074 RepID=A0A0W0YRA7_9GAMM|nr:hypothetical protein [Legionella santicrucis]KTD59059.1 hypothetical protein Lsan_2456 [Legionella santicrucis]
MQIEKILKTNSVEFGNHEDNVCNLQVDEAQLIFPKKNLKEFINNSCYARDLLAD